MYCTGQYYTAVSLNQVTYLRFEIALFDRILAQGNLHTGRTQSMKTWFKADFKKKNAWKASHIDHRWRWWPNGDHFQAFHIFPD